MKKSLLLLIIFFIWLFGLLSFLITINYLDPYQNKTLAIFLITFSFILMVSWLWTIILYFIKKIHYRWEVELYHIKTSFRQSLFTAFYIIWVILLIIIKAPLIVLASLLLLIFIFLELFIQNLN